MRTRGEIEAIAGDVVNRFLQRTVGRGPSATTVTFADAALVVHLRDVLTPAERSLTKVDESERSRAESMVRGIRDHIVRSGRAELAAALRDAVGRQPAAVLHDVDPSSGDEVVVFLFAADAPAAEAARLGRASRPTGGPARISPSSAGIGGGKATGTSPSGR